MPLGVQLNVLIVNGHTKIFLKKPTFFVRIELTKALELGKKEESNFGTIICLKIVKM